MLTAEQRQRMEVNRLAALERKRLVEEKRQLEASRSTQPVGATTRDVEFGSESHRPPQPLKDCPRKGLTEEQKKCIEANRLAALDRKRQREEEEEWMVKALEETEKRMKIEEEEEEDERMIKALEETERRLKREEREEEEWMVRALEATERQMQMQQQAAAIPDRGEGTTGMGLSGEQKQQMDVHFLAELSGRCKEEEEQASKSSQNLTQTPCSLPHSPTLAPASPPTPFDTPPKN